MSGVRSFRFDRLLPIACIAGALVLGASEFTTTFEFAPPGIDPIGEQSAADRHGYALLVVAAFAIVAVFVAVLGGSKPAALAVGAMGVIGLLVFLIVDLPDAGAVGTFDDGSRQSFFEAEAIPQAGFWLEMLGALALAISGIALATLSREQLAALRPEPRPGRRARPGAGEAPADATGPAPGPGGSAGERTNSDGAPASSPERQRT